MSGDRKAANNQQNNPARAASLADRAKNSLLAITSWAPFASFTKPAGGPIDPAFLPASLEILEKPPSPVGRTVIWVVVATAGLALTWACLAQVDEVAVAPGRIIPRSRLQTVEPAETGVVRAILVREGERAAAGQPLIELDPTFADAGPAIRSQYLLSPIARATREAGRER